MINLEHKVSENEIKAYNKGWRDGSNAQIIYEEKDETLAALQELISASLKHEVNHPDPAFVLEIRKAIWVSNSVVQTRQKK